MDDKLGLMRVVFRYGLLWSFYFFFVDLNIEDVYYIGLIVIIKDNKDCG